MLFSRLHERQHWGRFDAAAFLYDHVTGPKSKPAFPARGILYGHTGCVNAFSISASGRLLASAGDDTQVFVWSALDRPTRQAKPLAIFEGHRANVFCTLWTRDTTDDRLLSCGRDSYIYLYDVEKGMSVGRRKPHGPMRSFEVHTGAVHRLAWLPGFDHVFLSAGDDEKVYLWDERTSQLSGYYTFGASAGSLHGLSTHPVRPFEFLVGGEGILKRCDIRMAKAARSRGTRRWIAAEGVPDMAVVSFEGAPPPDELRYRPLAGVPRLDVCGCKYNRRGDLFVTTNLGGCPLVYHVDHQYPIAELVASGYICNTTIKSATFFGLNDEFVCGGSEDLGLYIWDVSKISLDPLQETPDSATSAAAAAHTPAAESKAEGGQVQQQQQQQQAQERKEIEKDSDDDEDDEEESSGAGVALRRLLDALPMRGSGGSSERSDGPKVPRVSPVRVLRGHRSIPNSVHFHPDLMRLYTVGVEKVVRVWSLERFSVEDGEDNTSPPHVPFPWPPADSKAAASSSPAPMDTAEESASDGEGDSKRDPTRKRKSRDDGPAAAQDSPSATKRPALERKRQEGKDEKKQQQQPQFPQDPLSSLSEEAKRELREAVRFVLRRCGERDTSDLEDAAPAQPASLSSSSSSSRENASAQDNNAETAASSATSSAANPSSQENQSSASPSRRQGQQGQGGGGEAAEEEEGEGELLRFEDPDSSSSDSEAEGVAGRSPSGPEPARFLETIARYDRAACRMVVERAERRALTAFAAEEERKGITAFDSTGRGFDEAQPAKDPLMRPRTIFTFPETSFLILLTRHHDINDDTPEESIATISYFDVYVNQHLAEDSDEEDDDDDDEEDEEGHAGEPRVGIVRIIPDQDS